MRIRLLQSAVFRDRKSLDTVQPEVRLSASVDTQVAPDWIVKDPYFALLEDDGKLEVVTSTAAKRIALANQPNVGLAGTEPTTDMTTDSIAAKEEAFNKAAADLAAARANDAKATDDAKAAADAKAKAAADAKAQADADAAKKADSDAKAKAAADAKAAGK